MSDIEIRRHTGVVTGTGSRIFLVFRKIPDDEEYCLVVHADSLPDQLAQNLDTIVMSREAQAEVDLYNVLHRRQFSDGSQVLNTLHERKLLSKMPVTSIEMTPLRGHTVPLSVINDDIDGNAAESAAATSAVLETASAVSNEELKSEMVSDVLDPSEQAKNMMEQAQEMKKMAEDLKKQALAIDPSLKPKKGRPSENDSEEAKKERRNEKRRAAYAKKKSAVKSKS
jgi:hypothetical protein